MYNDGIEEHSHIPSVYRIRFSISLAIAIFFKTIVSIVSFFAKGLTRIVEFKKFCKHLIDFPRMLRTHLMKLSYS